MLSYMQLSTFFQLLIILLQKLHQSSVCSSSISFFTPIFQCQCLVTCHTPRSIFHGGSGRCDFLNFIWIIYVWFNLKCFIILLLINILPELNIVFHCLFRTLLHTVDSKFWGFLFFLLFPFVPYPSSGLCLLSQQNCFFFCHFQPHILRCIHDRLIHTLKCDFLIHFHFWIFCHNNFTCAQCALSR